MKIYDIVMFLVMFLCSMNILAYSHFLDSPNCGTSGFTPCTDFFYQDTMLKMQSDLMGSDVSPKTDSALSYPELAISAFGLLIRSLVAIVLIFGYVTVLLPLFLQNMLGISPLDPLSMTITLGVWITYVMGYAQYRARSTLQGTE